MIMPKTAFIHKNETRSKNTYDDANIVVPIDENQEDFSEENMKSFDEYLQQRPKDAGNLKAYFAEKLAIYDERFRK